MASIDVFKDDFKRYKKFTASDLRNLIDVRTPEYFTTDVIYISISPPHRVQKDDMAHIILPLTEFSSSEVSTLPSRFGLRPTQEWKMYRLKSIPGLIIIPNPFLPGSQFHWMGKCLIDYPCKPNICNLDAHIERNREGRLWPPSDSLSPSPSSPPASLHSGQPQCDDDLVEDKDEVPVKKRIKLSVEDGLILSKGSDLYKLRWVTLGYQYDWNTKEYYRDKWSPFPEELGEMAKSILNACGFPNFCAEAGIVNYYHMDSTLSGHTDHSEKDLSRPLLSLSFGQSAIFLIGGPTKQVKPKALLLNSGDIVIMSGESRLAYHGIPKILPSHFDKAQTSDGKNAFSVPECLCKAVCETYLESHAICGLNCIQKASHTRTRVDQSNEAGCNRETQAKSLQEKRGCPSCEELIKTWQLFESYMSISRINVNIRQVTSDKCTF